MSFTHDAMVDLAMVLFGSQMLQTQARQQFVQSVSVVAIFFWLFACKSGSYICVCALHGSMACMMWFFLDICTCYSQGLAGIVGNPVLSQAIAGLATSATAQATLERVMLFDLKDKIVEPFGETAQQVFARISAMRDSLDGPQVCSCPCG